jgi:branched-chain amino acid transport system ATP-binding protein
VPDQAVLSIEAITVRFGGVTALDDVSIEVPAGVAVGVIGPNGAGKTTMLNAVCGYVRPSSGTTAFEGQDITRWSPARRARAGIGRTFQVPRLFPEMTARDNLSVVDMQRPRQREALGIDEALAVVGITHLGDRDVDHLVAGERRFVEVARALMLGPRLLLLDEPATGLRDAEVESLSGVINHLVGERAVAVLLISHDMRVINDCCTRVVVLEGGEVLMVGDPETVRSDPRVIDAYFGSEVPA